MRQSVHPRPAHLAIGSTVMGRSAHPALVVTVYADQCLVAVEDQLQRVNFSDLTPATLEPVSAERLQQVVSLLDVKAGPGTCMDDLVAAGRMPRAGAQTGIEDTVSMRAGKRALATPNGLGVSFADKGSTMTTEEAHQKYFGQH